MNLQHLMKRVIWTCSPTDSLNTPAQMMWEHGVAYVVVREEEKTVGLVTDRAVSRVVADRGLLWAVRVRECMEPFGAVLRVDCSIQEAHHLMQARCVRRLPVEDQSGALVGLVSFDDLARAC